MRNQYWNHRLPQNQPRNLDSLREHLLTHRKITEKDCWEWTLALSKSGYGKIKWRPYGDLRVHRVAAFLWLGFDLKSKNLICHRCDNPKCFNPSHLFVGTGRDNQRDAVQKNRNYMRKKKMCRHGHLFTSENTYFDKKGARHCRTCHRKQVLASYYMSREVEK